MSDELEIGVRLNKLNGEVANNAEWVVTDTTEDFGGNVHSATVVSESEHDEYDGLNATVEVADLGVEWEVIGG